MQGSTSKGMGPDRLVRGTNPPPGPSLTDGRAQTPSLRLCKAPPPHAESRTVTDSMAIASFWLSLE